MITEQKEVRLWHFIKGKLSKENVDLQRIENTTGSGVPDVNACWRGKEAWMELKVYHQGNVVLRKEQYAWIKRRASVDGNVMVIAHNPETDQIEVFLPEEIEVRIWGTASKYVAITNEPDYIFEKTDDVSLYLKAIFGE